MRRAVSPVRYEDYYSFSAKDAEKSIIESCKTPLMVERKKGQNHNVTVVCDPNFMSQLLPYLNWGENSPLNYLEDVLHISGEIYKDNEKTVIIPRFLIRIVTTERRKTAVVTTEENKTASAKQNYMINSNIRNTDYHWLSNFAKLEIVGHGHTHPDLGFIGTKPSGTDRNDHAKNVVDCDVWLSMIIDPVRCDISFYCGESMSQPDVVYMLYPKDATLFKYGTTVKRTAPKTRPVHISNMPVINNTEFEETVHIIEPREVVKEIIKVTEGESFNDIKTTSRTKKNNNKKQRKLKKKAKMEFDKMLSNCSDCRYFLQRMIEVLDECEMIK